ncbi:ankyrin repeat domain-containing protein 54-like [Sycon ciliatum]|uniref:ankyrin repeat domain-containing protein 54-like n=1 Tax=Sycon ciliatum TaxID=27933 RepID=UPI0020AB32F5|eukprot:scpid85727/ scgid9344/ Ankyrin repeat domain-containing protein 54
MMEKMSQGAAVTSSAGEFSFAGSSIDVRSMALIDPSTYVAPGADGVHEAAGKVKQRRSRQRAGPLSQRSSDVFHRNITEHKLFQAVNGGDLDQVKNMLTDDDLGFDASHQDKCGRTPLHVAAAAGNNQMVRLLLDHGANPSLQDNVGNTPLHLAACTSKVATVTILLAAGTDVSLVDCRGNTPVRLAQARLKHLRSHGDTMSLTDHSRAIEQVAYMMREYARCVGDEHGVEHVFDITAKLSKSTNHNQVSEVADLLQTFTSMKLKS